MNRDFWLITLSWLSGATQIAWLASYSVNKPMLQSILFAAFIICMVGTGAVAFLFPKR